MTTLTLIQPNQEIPVLIFTTQPDPATYRAALKLVRRIDADLTSGRRHFRSRGGKLLTRLDEVVQAILDNDLVIGEAAVDRTWFQDVL